eukprot:CAMPEP_0201889892 /NCGR_PEP_ID=MMETSP0902-20130614/31089_1 /ASSEMBLY_ACC=CAM_ASM_000551 /TAXON_ID=420261 /ORGANISM="Thalassiosira antarctica, Strain CCMP982" /LENGTH=179 /DNA_ID=CAMNT_0048420607 /DNA_START=214 /DNA_END=751 /DNA_ORIENTATION=+
MSVMLRGNAPLPWNIFGRIAEVALLMVLLLDADVSDMLLVSLMLTVVDDGTPPIEVGDNAVLANNASCVVPFKPPPPPPPADDDEPQKEAEPPHCDNYYASVRKVSPDADETYQKASPALILPPSSSPLRLRRRLCATIASREKTTTSGHYAAELAAVDAAEPAAVDAAPPTTTMRKLA